LFSLQMFVSLSQYRHVGIFDYVFFTLFLF